MDIGYITTKMRGLDERTFTRTGIPRVDSFSRLAPANDPLTEHTRNVWSAGAYDPIAAGYRHDAQAFVARQELTSWQHVLDAACGTGNLTIPAARAGAQVSGVDLVPAMLDAAGAWAAREDLRIMFDQGTAENLCYADAQFDVVLSMFGVMFAARPDRVIGELARVTRPGGHVAIANWTRRGFIGRLLTTLARHVPPHAGVPNPLLWGDESVIRRRFDERDWYVTTTLRTLTLCYPHTPAGTAELFRSSYGPIVHAFEVLAEDRRSLLAAELAAHWLRAQRPAAETTEVNSEYLEVIAIRRRHGMVAIRR